MAGIRLRVMEVEEVGNGEVYYTVTIHSGDKSTYLDNKYLTPQTPYYRQTSLRGEYGESWDETLQITGYRTFYNMMGTGEANKTYSISSRADDMMRSKGKGGVNITELIKFNDWDPNDPSRLNIPDQAAKVAQIGLLKAMEEGIITYSFVLAKERECIEAIIQDIENELMWGTGGYSEQDGPDGIRTSVGLCETIR